MLQATFNHFIKYKCNQANVNIDVKYIKVDIEYRNMQLYMSARVDLDN